MTISPRISTESNNFDRRLIYPLKKNRKSTVFFQVTCKQNAIARCFPHDFFISLEVFSKTPASDKVPNTIGLDVIPPAIVRDTKRHLVVNYTTNSIL